ncbi:BnaA04g21910D [Brassica napus]|uniref:(rape) hypothetical protein n=1 Tax=Brassica napus TaxID=3708 RepID=A0A078FZB5_BRANA|nr:unnamed protein product [Brassica napus]CDY18396.1 BnaA04g21910D [Brassica napus]
MDTYSSQYRSVAKYVLLLFFLDMAQKRKCCNLMEVTSEIGMPLLRLHPKKKRRNTQGRRQINFFCWGKMPPSHTMWLRHWEYLMASHYKESLFDALLNDKKLSEVNPPLIPGQTQTRRIGYTVPAHIIEFAPEIGWKVMAFKRIKRIMKKVAAFKRMKRTLKTRSGLL